MKKNKLKLDLNIKEVYQLATYGALITAKRFVKVFFSYNINNKSKESAFEYCKRTEVSYEKLCTIGEFGSLNLLK